jgi:hypothetical protein
MYLYLPQRLNYRLQNRSHLPLNHRLHQQPRLKSWNRPHRKQTMISQQIS